jgi:hypothetical protein
MESGSYTDGPSETQPVAKKEEVLRSKIADCIGVNKGVNLNYIIKF